MMKNLEIRHKKLLTYKAQNVIIILLKGNRRKPERRKMNEDMNMQENARLVLGLRSAGWSEKKSMIFTLHRNWR